MFGPDGLAGHQRFTDAIGVLGHNPEFVGFAFVEIADSRFRGAQECADLLPPKEKEEKFDYHLIASGETFAPHL